MDEAERQSSETVGGQRTPEEIERDIERTRQELGETVAAVAERADVKTQARKKSDELKEAATAKRDELLAKAKSATPDDVSAGAQQVAGQAQRNPLPFAVGGALLAGFALGRLTAR